MPESACVPGAAITQVTLTPFPAAAACALQSAAASVLEESSVTVRLSERMLLPKLSDAIAQSVSSLLSGSVFRAAVHTPSVPNVIGTDR